MTLQPLLIAEGLKAVGAPGWLVLAALAGVSLYHFRELLGIAATLAFTLRIVAGIGAVMVFAAAGYIPGVELSVDVGVVWGSVTDAVDLVARIVGEIR